MSYKFETLDDIVIWLMSNTMEITRLIDLFFYTELATPLKLDSWKAVRTTDRDLIGEQSIRLFCT